MKKVFVTAFMIVGLVFNSHAQKISKNALGLRLSENDGIGIGASYQRGLMKNYRLEFELGVRNHNYNNDGYHYDTQTVKFVGLFQWVWAIDKGFNWYAGIGGGFGSYSNREKENNNDYPDNGGFGLVAGDIGIEYNFRKFPLQLFVDVRPEVGFGDYKYTNSNLNTFGPDIGTGARFRF